MTSLQSNFAWVAGSPPCVSTTLACGLQDCPQQSTKPDAEVLAGYWQAKEQAACQDPGPMAEQARSRTFCAVLLLLNILAATTIVFVNKLVLSVYDFRFIYFLTFIHSLVTLGGMMAFSAFGLYKRKAVPVMQVGPKPPTTARPCMQTWFSVPTPHTTAQIHMPSSCS